MTSLLRRAAALAVALLCLLPLHRLLEPGRDGPSAMDALAKTEPLWTGSLWGLALVLLIAFAAAALNRRSQPGSGITERAIERAAAALGRPGRSAYAFGLASLATLLASLQVLLLQRRLLTGVDEMVELTHARYLAAGRLGGALPSPVEAWLIPNTLMTEHGWVSQYPPGHLFIWSAFVAAGLWWAIGPALFGLTTGLTAASLERLVTPERRVHARAAALLVAVSPFLVLLSGGSSSHVTAGAAGAAALYSALRLRDGRTAWALVAGVAVAIMVLSRPWTGLVLGPALTLGVWLEVGGPTLLRRGMVPWIVGGIPFAALLLWYDATLFGSPFTLGYEKLYGPSHGLGLHADPWSFPYGVRQAVAYTASDLIQLGVLVLETPTSLVLFASAYLVWISRLERGTRVVAWWALAPVFANALYWFHAPRMLSEAAPAWILLVVLAFAHVHERAGHAVRVGIRVGAAALLVAAVALVPGRLRTQAWPGETLSRIVLPEGAANGGLVFVHAAWDERLAAMLQASGMRNDSIQAIVRRNDTCQLHEYATARLAGETGTALPVIDLEQTPADAPDLVALRSIGGSVVWRGNDSEWPDTCVREMMADRYGTIALAPLLWQGDLPGVEQGGPMFVRDFGPERNAAVMRHFPERDAMVWAYPPSGRPMLLPYDMAMETLWGTR